MTSLFAPFSGGGAPVKSTPGLRRSVDVVVGGRSRRVRLGTTTSRLLAGIAVAGLLLAGAAFAETPTFTKEDVSWLLLTRADCYGTQFFGTSPPGFVGEEIDESIETDGSANNPFAHSAVRTTGSTIC